MVNFWSDLYSLYKRNLFHLIFGSVLPLAAFFINYEQINPVGFNGKSQGVSIFVIYITIALLFLAILCEVSRFSFKSLNSYLLHYMSGMFKPSETTKVTGATYMLLGTLVVFLFFDKIIAVSALLFLSIGDPLAAIVGSKFGRLRIGKKSIEGSITFLISGLGIAYVITLIGLPTPYWVLSAGVLTGMLVELSPLTIDDNLMIPIVAGAAMTILS